jgi:predicted PurR-regulated permease PerM
MLGVDLKAARAAWTVILVLLLCLVTYSIRQTLFIFVVALLFAYLLLPLVDFIDRVLPMARSRTPALAIVYALLVGGLILSGIEIGSRVTQQGKNLAQKISDYLKPEQTQNLPLPQAFKPMGDRILSLLRSEVQQHYQQILEKLPQTALKAVGAFANIIFVIIVPILSFFFLKDGRALQRYVVAQFEDAVDRGVLRDIAADLNLLLAEYMRALVLLGLSAAISYGIFFTIMGVPYAILLAVIAFPLEFIPMLGPLVSAGIIITVSAISGFHHMLALLAFLAIYRILQDYVISPHLMSAGMELHPLLVIFGVFAGEQMAGIPGAFLSVPTMAVLRMLYFRLERARVRKEIVSDEVAPAANEVVPAGK